MLKNKKIAAAMTIAGAVALTLASLVGAQTGSTPLAASCSGAVSTNVITWTASSTGGTSPYTYLWSGTNVSGTSSVAVATYSATGTYSATVLVGNAATSTVTTSCSATVLSLPTPPPPPPPTVPPPVVRRVPFFKEPMLNINPGGHFLARGMIVQSVASGSFIGRVWGTTWTVNVSNFVEFVLRDGKGVKISALDQLQPGDEVGVLGKVDPNHELTVNGEVVRNYSILVVRSKHQKDADDVDDNEEREAKLEKRENSGKSENSGKKDNEDNHGRDNQGIKNQIEKLLEQIGQIQEQLKNR